MTREEEEAELKFYELQSKWSRRATLQRDEREKLEKEFAEHLRVHRSREIEAVWKCSGIPERQARCLNIDRSGEWGVVEKKILARIGKGFLIALVGVRGNGKTQIAVEIIKRLAMSGKYCTYRTTVGFFMEVKDTYKKNSEFSELGLVEKMAQTSLLVFDELGQRSDNDWENRILYELLNRRYNALMDTILISNQESASLEDSLGPSIVSRMQETGGIIECKWDSYRNTSRA